MSSPFTIEADPAGADIADPRIPARSQVVTRLLLERWHREIPDKVFVKFADDGEEWTYRDLRREVLQAAVGLQSLGVAQGDRVLVWLPNCREHLRAYFAINVLGAVYVPLNTAYRGKLLAHVIASAQARVMVLHAGLVDRLVGLPTAALADLVVVADDHFPPLPGLAIRRHDDSLRPSAGVVRSLARPIEPWDPQSIIFTSGTTGASKAVLSSYLHMYSNTGPESWFFITEEDRMMINMPMCHIGGMGPTYTMFARGGSIAYAERFETSTFLQATRRTQATAVVLLGAMAGFLEKQPPAPDDLDNPLRKVFLVPLPANFEAFGRRFGVDVYTMFNMTEVNCPLIGEPGQLVPGTCGRRRRGVDVRLVDANDCEVPQGTLGELIVRADRPWALNSGYCNDDAATVAAWRNGWFHTGDCFREDEHGNFFFLDRRKDMIRRRGENISSMEVEAEINAYPGVAEATTVGVCGEGGEDEILAIVVPREASPLDPVALLEFLRERLPHFMVPRFVRQVVELPKTPTMKVRKQVLRDEGLTADTWDRERAGIQLRAQPLSTARAPQGSPAPHSATPRRP